MSSVFGIDFGTSNSCISTKVNNSIITIQDLEGNYFIPTVIYLGEDENLFGHQALELKNRNCYLENIIVCPKRLIGKSYSEFINDSKLKENFIHNKIACGDNDDLLFILNNKNYSIIDIISIFLNHLKNIILSYDSSFNQKEINIVITIPAYYNDHQREILKSACEMVNFNVLRIINEPTATSLAYASNILLDETEYILTFDCGGGTTDLTLLELDYSLNLYEVKNVIGNNFLGGEDLTNNIVNHIKNKILVKYPNFKFCSKYLNIIQRESENIKKQLSFSKSANIILEFGDIFFSYTLSRIQFLDISKDFFNKIKKLISFIINDSTENILDFNCNKIKHIIFVGGTTRINFLEILFKELLPNVKINKKLDPDQTISIGATIQGSLLIDSKLDDIVLLDVLPLSLGVEVLGGLMSPIISRNTIIPVSRKKVFTNSKSFEESIQIDIYQGERKLVKDNYHLATFELIHSILNEAEEGTLKIEVTFNIDSNGIISSNANLIQAQLEQKIIINKISNLNKNNLNDILLNAELNKLYDSETGNQILNKLELYDSFKFLLNAFHNIQETKDFSKYTLSEINNLFNKIFDIITKYKSYTAKELKITKQKFEERWHELIFAIDPIFKDENDLIIPLSGTNLEDI